MGAEPRLSAATLRVLSTLIVSGREEMSGAEIGREAEVSAGTLYPILARLERASWVESRWEIGDPKVLGRPRRRFYRITALGAAKTEAALRDLAPALRRLAWS